MRYLFWALALSLVGFVTFWIGFFNGQANVVSITARAEARCVYEMAKAQNHDGMKRAGLARSKLIDELVEIDAKSGPIISLQINEVVYTGAKRLISMSVRRTKGTFDEELFGIGPSGFDHCSSGPASTH